MKKLKPCLLTTYVYGEMYQAFIPLLVYSCKRAYPEYDIMLFLHDSLSNDVKKLLKEFDLYDKVIFKENTFQFSNTNSLTASSTRWILWDEIFWEYSYLYVVDVDMFYIREPKPLHLQHAERTIMTGLPFDNLRRITMYPKTLKNILRRIKYAHFHLFFKFIFSRRIVEQRLTGLHFVDIHRFYTKENLEYIKRIKEGLNKRYFFPEVMISNNEALLFRMMTDLGYDCTKLGCQSSADKMLPFDNNLREEFRPHHGIHLGIFKKQYFNEMDMHTQSAFKPILDSETYNYYVSKFKVIFMSDEFQRFYISMPLSAKIYIDRLNAYYGIHR